MKKETRKAVFDEELKIEAYQFQGIAQTFPNHFHEHYVIGYVENGERFLSCKNKDHIIKKSSILLFNPGDNHECTQTGSGTFDYRGFNISQSVMLDFAVKLKRRRELPVFSVNVVYNDEITSCLRSLHEAVLKNDTSYSEKQEMLMFLISALIHNYEVPYESCVPECRWEIEKACEFIHRHFNERISLDCICRYVGLSKSTLLREFIKAKGITPYRYLESIRINKAKDLLEKGIQPIEAAMQTGFSDQSHFTNYFNSFIGITPGVYHEIFNEKFNSI